MPGIVSWHPPFLYSDNSRSTFVRIAAVLLFYHTHINSEAACVAAELHTYRKGASL